MPNNSSIKTILSTAELAKATAGGDDYIRTKDGVVKGLALRLDLNPDAPDAIVFGKGPQIEKRAQLLLDSGLIVPAYVKRATNAWEYLGEYRATAIRRDAAAISHYGKCRKPGTAAGVLFLEGVSEPKVQISGGGYADVETRKEIEQTAIAYVVRHLRQKGYKVHDHQRENRGYDLLAEKTSELLLVEVKGTDSPTPRFFLTRNEYKCSVKQEHWRLFVVCRARSSPILHEYTAMELKTQFNFAPLAWECLPVASDAIT